MTTDEKDPAGRPADPAEPASNDPLDDLLGLFSAYDAAETFKARLNEHRARMRELLVELLGVMDALQDFESYSARPESDGVAGARKRVELVRRMLGRALAAQNVVPMRCEGLPVDLERHQVIAVKHRSDVSDDIVLEESVRGYFWEDGVLRPAKVVVSGSKASTQVGPDEGSRTGGEGQ